MQSTEVYTVEHHPDRDSWLRARGTAIGGSEAAAVWALPDAYDSPYSLWCKKRGLLPDTEASEELEIGALIEPVVAELYQRRTGRRLTWPGPYTILRSKRWPWMAVSVDRLIDPLDAAITPRGARAERGVLEAKNRGVGAAKSWREAVPDEVQAQVQHAIAVTGYAWGAAGALIGGNRFLWADMDAMPTFVEEHVAKCAELHRRIELGDPPPVDGHAATTEALVALHQREQGGTIVRLPPEAPEWVQVIDDCDREIKILDGRREAARNAIKAVIGDAEVGLMPDGVSSWSWRRLERKGYQVEAGSYRKLTYKRRH